MDKIVWIYWNELVLKYKLFSKTKQKIKNQFVNLNHYVVFIFRHSC
jgi:hypothetical protein